MRIKFNEDLSSTELTKRLTDLHSKEPFLSGMPYSLSNVKELVIDFLILMEPQDYSVNFQRVTRLIKTYFPNCKIYQDLGP